jgi:hypothetical protein
MTSQAGSPLRVGECLRTSIQVAAAGFPLYFALAFIAYVPILLAHVLQAASAWGLAALLVPVLLSFVAASVTSMMIANLRRTPYGFADALSRGQRAMLPILGVLVILLLLFFGLALVAGFAWSTLRYGVLGSSGPLVVLFLISVGIAAVRLAVVVPVVVVERPGVIAGVQRSLELTRGSAWKLFWTLATGVLLVAVSAFVVFAIALAAFGPAGPLLIVTNYALAAAASVYLWAVSAVLYYGLRTAAEAGVQFDEQDSRGAS